MFGVWLLVSEEKRAERYIYLLIDTNTPLLCIINQASCMNQAFIVNQAFVMNYAFVINHASVINHAFVNESTPFLLNSAFVIESHLPTKKFKIKGPAPALLTDDR